MRLHGPWHYEPLARTCIHADGRIDELPGGLPAAGTMKLPAVWHGTPLDGFRGRVRWTRRFHGPRSLEPHERLWLVFNGVDYFADVSLGGRLLGRHEGYFDSFDFDVTPLIRPRNELVVDVACPAEADPTRPHMVRGRRESLCPRFVGGIWRDVVLEVRSVAFLRDVELATHIEGERGVIMAKGLIVGDAGTRLGLELSIDGRHAASARFEASFDPMPFVLEAVVDPVELWWPRGMGAPRTYAIELELHGHARTLAAASSLAGFRRASLLVDSVGSANIEFNGRDQPVVFRDLVAVANFGPPTTAAALRTRASAGAGHGRVEIWRTGGEVLLPESYELADREGIVILQETPAPADCRDATARDRVRPMIQSLRRLLSHHPSVLLDHELASRA